MKANPMHARQRERSLSFPLVTRPASGALRERFASAILTCNRSELRQILCDIAEISAPSDSPDKFFRTMANVLIRTARCAVRQRASRKELRNLALTDGLTGLYNRRGFFAWAVQQLRRARRNHQRALLIFVGVGRLKQINDRLGHSGGDIAIMRVARILRDTSRDSDIVARIGKFEFAILAHAASEDSQKKFWRRLKRNLRADRSRDPRISLPLRIAVTRFDPPGTITLTEALEHAYRAISEANQSTLEGRFPQIPGKNIVSRISSEEANAENLTRPDNVRGANIVHPAPKSSSQAKVTLLFANLPGGSRTEAGT